MYWGRFICSWHVRGRGRYRGYEPTSSEQDVFCGEDTPSFNDNEGSFAAELSDNNDPVEEPDGIDSGMKAMHSRMMLMEATVKIWEMDDFVKSFRKLGQETLPHQATTKVQACVLVLTYTVSAGLIYAQVRGHSHQCSLWGKSSALYYLLPEKAMGKQKRSLKGALILPKLPRVPWLILLCQSQV